jgi:hypothetical protein
VPVASRAELETASRCLLEALMPPAKAIRLLGVTLSGLDQDDDAETGPQMRLEL